MGNCKVSDYLHSWAIELSLVLGLIWFPPTHWYSAFFSVIFPVKRKFFLCFRYQKCIIWNNTENMDHWMQFYCHLFIWIIVGFMVYMYNIFPMSWSICKLNILVEKRLWLIGKAIFNRNKNWVHTVTFFFIGARGTFLH